MKKKEEKKEETDALAMYGGSAPKYCTDPATIANHCGVVSESGQITPFFHTLLSRLYNAPPTLRRGLEKFRILLSV